LGQVHFSDMKMFPAKSVLEALRFWV